MEEKRESFHRIFGWFPTCRLWHLANFLSRSGEVFRDFRGGGIHDDCFIRFLRFLGFSRFYRPLPSTNEFRRSGFITSQTNPKQLLDPDENEGDGFLVGA